MTINASLPVSSFISVTASIASPAVQGQGTQSLLILGTSTFIDVTARIAVFTSATAVNTLFGSTAAEAIAAGIWFSQNSAPLYIGRWAQTASSGQLIGAPLSATASLISTWTAITSGGLDISVNGASAELLTGLNFSSVTNLNGVASVIQGGLTGATIVYSASNNNFIVTSNTTGTTSTVGFATAPGSGTNISATLGLTSTSSGAYVANGIAAESALAAVTLFDADFGQLWYGLSVLGAADSDELAISSFLTSSTNKHFNFASTQEAGVLVAATTSDLASVLSLANVGKVAVQYNGASPYSAVSLAGKMLSVNYTGTNTVIAGAWQTEPNITPDQLNTTQELALLGKNCNAFIGLNNGASIVYPGIGSNGQYIDTTIGADALCLAIQTAIFNLLYTQHIPQTDPGMQQIKVTIESVLSQFATAGYIAPGVWGGAYFGTLQPNKDGSAPTLTSGYYVYQPPVANQSAAQRGSRISVPFQIAAKLAGAVQTVSVAILLSN
jgi:hypothetical protein